MSQRVVGEQTSDLVAVDGDCSTAEGASSVVGVGTVVGVGGEVPEENVPAPVASGSEMIEATGLLRLIASSLRAFTDARRVEVFSREGVVDLSHRIDGATVKMESGAVDVLVGRRIAQDGEG